jgi:hypothetical protein
VTGVNRLTRLPSGSRNSSARLPHGIVVGSVTTSARRPRIRSYSASTSSTMNSRIATDGQCADKRRNLGEQLVAPNDQGHDYHEFEHLRTEALVEAVLQATTPAVV